MNMGEHVSNFLTQPNILVMREEIKGFLEHVQLFYIEAPLQLKRRFPINDEILKSLTFLNPETINSTPSSDVINLASKFPNIIPTTDIHTLDDEWRELQFMDPNDLPSISSETVRRKDVVTFWGNIDKLHDT